MNFILTTDDKRNILSLATYNHILLVYYQSILIISYKKILIYINNSY